MNLPLDTVLKATWFDTSLGMMVAVSDDSVLYRLDFAEQRDIEQLRIKIKANIVVERSQPIDAIQAELKQYFQGSLKQFNTPVRWFGTPFQENVWKELQKIPHGETRSYLDLAKAINNPTAVRAVAQANGANRFAIIIPCHRVINHNGDLGGYAGGLHRKEWLLQHERG